MRQGRVVMARNGDAALGAGLGDLGAMRPGIFGRQSLLAVAEQCESLVGQATLGLVVEGILLHRLELTLTRCMVHQRNETDLRIVFKFYEMIQHVVGRDFAAQMDAMIGTEPVSLAACAKAFAMSRISPCSKPPSSSDPMRRQSKTVVIPEVTICASCAWIAAIFSQRTPGRGE